MKKRSPNSLTEGEGEPQRLGEKGGGGGSVPAHQSMLRPDEGVRGPGVLVTAIFLYCTGVCEYVYVNVMRRRDHSGTSKHHRLLEREGERSIELSLKQVQVQAAGNGEFMRVRRVCGGNRGDSGTDEEWKEKQVK